MLPKSRMLSKEHNSTINQKPSKIDSNNYKRLV